jgi:hypothetical protein
MRMRELKRFCLGLLYPGWRRKDAAREGYTFIMPAPMDMPFLCYLALAGLRELDLRNCREVLVVPDGWSGTDTRGLAAAVAAAGVKNDVRLLPVRHWAQIVESIDEADTDLIFLHDADAFFTDDDLLESSYALCRAQALQTLGVTARWDPAFTRIGMKLPGTWELMFSARWARSWRPIDHKSGLRSMGRERVSFDTMLYPQYRDYAGGKIQVRETESFLHLSGTIVTYRAFVQYRNRQVGDELFRLLFLSLLKEVSPAFGDECVLPSVAELAEGLRDPGRRVHYRFPAAAAKYAEFRAFLARLMDAPVLAASRSAIAAMVRPFDEHFAALGPDPRGAPATEYGKMRAHGLWLD